MAACDTLEGWIDFRRHETEGLKPVHHTCCICGGPAEGNSSFTDGSGDICDRCVALDSAE